jgi:hypothetical protein
MYKGRGGLGVHVTVEEGLLPEDHAGEHASKTPHVQRIVIVLQVQGSGFRVQGSGFRIQGSGFRAKGFRV